MAPQSPSEPWVKRAKWLTQALIISGMLNVGLLCTFIYSTIKEAKRPASGSDYAIFKEDLSKKKNLREVLSSYGSFSFQDLLRSLSNAMPLEAGYTYRDLALACLVHFHHFNLERALGGEVLEKREIALTTPEGGDPATLSIYPGLSNDQFQAVTQYAKTEKWPLTAEGLFLEMQSQSIPYDPSLLEAFYLTGEFHYLELLFSKTGIGLKRDLIAALLAQSSWKTLSQTAENLKQNNEFTLSDRRNFLAQLLFEGSILAAKIFLQADQDYCLKELDHEGLATLCRLLGDRVPSSFLKELLTSSQPEIVWKTAATILYEQATEEIPDAVDLAGARRRFIELKVDTPKPKKGQIYHVIAGDSLWKIARNHGVSVAKLRQANDLDSDHLKIGQRLTIP